MLSHGKGLLFRQKKDNAECALASGFYSSGEPVFERRLADVPQKITFYSKHCTGLYDRAIALYFDKPPFVRDFAPMYEEDIRNLPIMQDRLVFENCGKPSRRKPDKDSRKV